MTMRTVLAALAMLVCPAALAQIAVPLNCLPNEIMAAALEKYGETTIGAGLAKNGRSVVLQVNPDKRTFTILLRISREATCLLGAGEGWTEIEPGPAVKTGKDL